MFSFLWSGGMVWNVPLFIGLIIVGLVYTIVLRYLHEAERSHLKMVLFYSGLLLIYIIIGSPLSILKHSSFTVHMTYMSLLFFIVPPLLLMGIPLTFIERVKQLILKKFVISHTITLLIFACLFLLYHMSFMFNLFLQYPTLQTGYMLILFVLSLHVWSPLITLNNENERSRYAALNNIVLMPACLIYVATGLLGGMSIPFLSQFAELCVPDQSDLSILLPTWYNFRFDQVVAGIVMMGIHKLAIAITVKNRDRR
ncbi:cytochrome c oxidase assembly protein [Bacillus solimangrovi]|uniref:Cytochrome c oxidase assembly factor CtaG n=1 Tax=Bacillus solimangrovi TaxID=1305675 RepID=A0A1E5LEV7_9BACI|nr:cytochrome c oxidase assembly protein [Bacillus solimangrovi]OEH92596.1 hypothetical protein BFG57_15035 [Bacillus solimangrovi]